MSSAREKPITANKPALHGSPASDLAWIDAHVVRQHEYEDLPLNEAMLAWARLRKMGSRLHRIH